MKRLIREPLLHFVLIGIVAFAAYAYTQPGSDAAEPAEQIQLTFDELSQLVIVFQSKWRRDPTPMEMQRLVEMKVREEILYREAVAMGLDKDDTIVKRRMAQKLQFIAEDVAAAQEPSRTELKAWYADNSDTFALPGRVSFRQLYFSPDQHGSAARDAASTALEKLASQPMVTDLAESLADSPMLPDYYADRAPVQLATDFGAQFAAAVFKAKPGAWQGPIESGFGWHLVFVDSNIPGRTPAFEEVEPQVKVAWLSEQKAKAWEKAYAVMRAKYTVLIPVPADEASQSAAVPSAASSERTPTIKGAQ